MSVADDLAKKTWTSFGAVVRHTNNVNKDPFYASSGMTFTVKKPMDKPTYGSKKMRPKKPDGTPLPDPQDPSKPLEVDSASFQVTRLQIEIGGIIPSTYPQDYRAAYENTWFYDYGDRLVSQAITIPNSIDNLSVTHVITIEKHKGQDFMRQRSFWSDGELGDYGCC